MIHTGVADESVGWVLTEDGRVAATGWEDAPAADRQVALDGGVLVPAFRDGHVHLPATGLYAAGLDLRGERSTDVILDGFGALAGSGAILFGGNFEEPLSAPLTRHDLDRVVGAEPALLARADMHSCIVSTGLLDRLSIDGLEGVDRDENSAPTGYLRELAAAEAWRWFDANLGMDKQRAAVQGAIRLAYSKGIAEVHEMFIVEWRGWDSAERFLATIEGVALNVVTYLATTDIERVRAMGHTRIGGDWFLDGSFGSHTAWMNEPYTSAPPVGSPPAGISYRADDEVADFFSRAQDAGMQVGVHAIGDAAIEQAVATWEKVASAVGVDAVRARGHRLEHFECASDDHIKRAGKLGLLISAQPAFDRLWGGREGLYAGRIGWERAQGMNRFGSMMRAGLALGGGSDSTVTPMDPFFQMAALRDHRVPEQSVEPRVALSIMTQGVANLAADGGPRGAIAEGMPADLVLLDRDPLTTTVDGLLDTVVLGTWCHGVRVWPEAEAESA
jgi:predicted amidohydrolase YtcJ